MGKLIAERLGFLLLTVWIVTTVTFLLFRLMPGDPTLAYLSPTFNEETRRALLASFGLDKPLWQQYLIYMGNLLQGDLGTSFLQRVPVSQLLAQRVEPAMQLLQSVWAGWRQQHWGLAPVPPRLWRT